MIKLSDRHLIKISLISFLISFILLISLDSLYELETSNIDDLNLDQLNKNVKIIAIPKFQSKSSNMLFLTLDDNSLSTLKAVIFDFDKTLENKSYIFEGRLTLRKEEIELIVEKIIEI